MKGFCLEGQKNASHRGKKGEYRATRGMVTGAKEKKRVTVWSRDGPVGGSQEGGKGKKQAISGKR